MTDFNAPRVAAFVAASALTTLAAQAQVFDYDEAISGDLANDIAAPTDLGAAGIGNNSVRFSIANSNDPGGDFDVFTFQIRDGEELAAIILADYQGNDAISYIAFSDGSTFPVNPNDDPGGFLGGALFGPDIQSLGDDLLPDLQLPAAGGMGFEGPVGPGSYSVFVQQTGTPTDVQLVFVVVPTPASASLLLVAGIAAVRRSR